MYFSMTTLAKIGYGDYLPISDDEMLYTLCILFISIIFFSYVLDQFMVLMAIDPSKENIRTGHIAMKRFEMYFWLMRLSRFRDNKQIPKEFTNKLLDLLNHFFMKDRISVIYEGDQFLAILPNQLKKSILVGYIYDDVFSDFRKFFRPDLYLHTDLLEGFARCLKTRYIYGSK